MNDAQFKQHEEHMRRAIVFIQYWNLAKSVDDFLAAYGKPLDDESRKWASATASHYRKKGVELRNLNPKSASVDFDWSYLQMVGQKALAELGRRKDEATDAMSDLLTLRSEAVKILSELRKYKGAVIQQERETFDAQKNGHTNPA